MPRLWISAGALNGLLAVALGAYAAHGLENRLAPEALGWLETGARYELFHALALLAVASLAHREIKPSIYLGVAGWAFLIGTILFSGALYAMSLGGLERLAIVVPVGGAGFLIGWGTLFFYGLSPRSR